MELTINRHIQNIRLYCVEQWESTVLKGRDSPGGAMGFPRPKTHPAEVRFTALVLAHHVVTPSILLYGHFTLGTFLK